MLDGYPGKFAVLARRSGDTWFVGALNGEQKKHFEITFDFLEAGKTYSARIFSDDPVIGSRTNVKITTQEVNSKSVLSQEIMEMNGVALIIDPI